MTQMKTKGQTVKKSSILLPSLAGRGKEVGLSFFFFLLLLTSCGAGGGNFRVKGTFKNLNQGKFYVYSPDGVIAKIDTIRVDKGNFVYTTPCEDPGTLILVFPNFTEVPLFASSGKTVKIEGDATNLQAMVMSGTSDNELLSAFRHQIVGVAPPEVLKLAEAFVNEHPDSRAAVYIVGQYFIQTANPDYQKAQRLLKVIAEKQPKNITLTRLQKKAADLAQSQKGSGIPDFTAIDCKGRSINKSALLGAPVAVVTTFSSWNYDSQNTLRVIHREQRRRPGKIKVLSFFLDGNLAEMNRLLQRDTINWPVIADPNFFENSALQRFGLTAVNDNIVFHNGRVVARHLKQNELLDKIKEL